jgi:hypothetical protein
MTRGLQPPEDPRSLCLYPQLNLLNPPPTEKRFLVTRLPNMTLRFALPKFNEVGTLP